jgi:hypothetical protein
MQHLKATGTIEYTHGQAPLKRTKNSPTRRLIFSSTTFSAGAVHTRVLASAAHSTQAPIFVVQGTLQLSSSAEKEHPTVCSWQPLHHTPHQEQAPPAPSHTAEAKRQVALSRCIYRTYASPGGTGTGCRRRRRRAGARGEKTLAATRDRTGVLLDAHARKRAL